MSKTLHRSFRVDIDPGENGSYGVRLLETNGRLDRMRMVGRVGPARLERSLRPLRSAIGDSGHSRTALGPTRRKPLSLTEEAGVRLALALTAVDGITKPGRLTAILDAVERLSVEECFYWYAYTTAETHDARRRARALRLFLAEE